MRRYNQVKPAFLSATFAAQWGSYHLYQGFTGGSTGLAITQGILEWRDEDRTS
jgi:hypothetical protein